MKLYYKPGACSLASHIVLREIGADFQLERVDTDEMKTETGADYATVNPHGYVPALQLENGEVLSENSALLPFLADLYPGKHLAPIATSFERVRLQELLSFLSSELHKAFSPYFSGITLSGDALSAAQDKTRRRIDAIERFLADGRSYLTGNTYTVADIYAFVVLSWSGFAGLTLDAWPKTKAFTERIASRPAVKEAMVSEGLVAA